MTTPTSRQRVPASAIGRYPLSITVGRHEQAHRRPRGSGKTPEDRWSRVHGSALSATWHTDELAPCSTNAVRDTLCRQTSTGSKVQQWHEGAVKVGPPHTATQWSMANGTPIQDGRGVAEPSATSFMHHREGACWRQSTCHVPNGIHHRTLAALLYMDGVRPFRIRSRCALAAPIRYQFPAAAGHGQRCGYA